MSAITETASSSTIKAKATIESPIAVPTYGGGGTYSMLVTARLPCAPLTCLLETLNAPNYAQWNSFCRQVTIDAQPTTIGNVASSASELSNTAFAALLADTAPDKLHLGSRFTMHACPKGPGTKPYPTALEVSLLKELDDGRRGYCIAWKGVGFSEWSLRTERVQEFVEIPAEEGGGTEYKSWETMGGVLGRVVKNMVAHDLVALFEAWAEDLGGWCEKVEKGKSTEANGLK